MKRELIAEITDNAATFTCLHRKPGQSPEILALLSLKAFDLFSCGVQTDTPELRDIIKRCKPRFVSIYIGTSLCCFERSEVLIRHPLRPDIDIEAMYEEVFGDRSPDYVIGHDVIALSKLTADTLFCAVPISLPKRLTDIFSAYKNLPVTSITPFEALLLRSKPYSHESYLVILSYRDCFRFIGFEDSRLCCLQTIRRSTEFSVLLDRFFAANNAFTKYPAYCDMGETELVTSLQSFGITVYEAPRMAL